MQKTKINWGYGDNFYTWNPITGCRRGCKYCYACRIHERFYKTPFSEISYHPTRMDDLEWLGKKEPSTVFVGSMSDIEYWPENLTQHILDEIKYYHKHTFMFLSKNAKSYFGIKWPQNTMQGLTITGQENTNVQNEKIINMQNLPRPFLSIEPLMGCFEIAVGNKFERVIVGAQTGPGAVKPKPEWIQSIKDNVHTQIFWKDSIKKYL